MDSTNFLQPGQIDGINLFAYCGNNPVMHIDENGNLFFIVLAVTAAILLTPIGGTIAQVATSVVSYTGAAVASIWDEEIREDMKAIKWNPFNSNEDLVLESNKMSFYKGVPVFKSSLDRSGSFYAIFLNERADETTLKHERGHNWQAMMMGVGTYALAVGIPSWKKWGPWAKARRYYDAPWETMANILGGVETEIHSNNPHSSSDKRRAWLYFSLSIGFLPVAYLVLLWE